jgi:hypothetical protein
MGSAWRCSLSARSLKGPAEWFEAMGRRATRVSIANDTQLRRRFPLAVLTAVRVKWGSQLSTNEFLTEGPFPRALATCGISDAIAEIAAHATFLVQPTSPSVDDLYPAVLVFRALERVGVSRDALAFALCRTLADDEHQARAPT